MSVSYSLPYPPIGWLEWWQATFQIVLYVPSNDKRLMILLDAKFESINFIELVLKMCEGNLSLRIKKEMEIIAF
jgi:hypothetical protein